jgi:sugar lactone lactonase YvrE
MRSVKTLRTAMVCLIAMGFAVVFTAQQVTALPYNEGDVFAGVGNGKINHYAPDGTLIQVLDNTSGSSEQTGMAFDTDGNLYTTNFTDQSMAKFDNNGGLLVYPWGGPFGLRPESVVLDAAGNLYTGEVDGAELLRKWTPAGMQIATFSPAIEDRGIDWIDLAADQCTMFYTSEGWQVKRYDVCTDTQLADFATLPTQPAYALRIRQNGEVLVAATSAAHRLAADGSLIQSYTATDYGETSFWFALNLDPDGETFWTAGYSSGDIYRINIETGALVTSFNAPPEVSSVAGLAIFGEPTAGQLVVYLDIKPTSCPNPLNTKSNGKLPVAILGSDVFDVADVDVTTIMLEGVAPLRSSYEDVATPFEGELCDCHEEGPDGYLDLVLHFDTQSIVEALGDVADGEVIELMLTFLTHDGVEVETSDCVWIKHKVKEPPPPPRIFTRTFDGSDSEIAFSLSEATDVSLVVYSVEGRQVRNLVNGIMPAGDHRVSWDGTDDAGTTMANGVYFCRAKVGSIEQTVKMVHVK